MLLSTIKAEIVCRTIWDGHEQLVSVLFVFINARRYVYGRVEQKHTFLATIKQGHNASRVVIRRHRSKESSRLRVYTNTHG